jgi:hypothetical protein
VPKKRETFFLKTSIFTTVTASSAGQNTVVAVGISSGPNQGLSLWIEYVPDIERTTSGKHRFVISRL